jgi:RNA polymerase sigma-70 factor (ECF subfamily)
VDRSAREQLHRDLVRLADGDRGAFDPAFRALWPVLLRFCGRALQGDPRAEDVAQVALMKLFARASEMDPERDGLSWALGIAAWECRTARQQGRRSKEQPAPAEALALAVADATPESLLIQRDLEAAALEIIGTLKPADADALRLAMDGERPAGPTFRKRLERAVSRLRSAWRTTNGS